MATNTTTTAGIANRVDQTGRVSAAAGELVGVYRDVQQSTLDASGACVPPLVSALDARASDVLVGTAHVRPMHRGSDAVEAIGFLGMFPAALGVSHVVVAWDHLDLCAAIQEPPPDGFGSAFVVLVADRDGHHVLHWFPYELQVREDDRGQITAIRSLWAAPNQFANAPLPPPVTDLLHVWRTGSASLSAADAMEGMTELGYRVSVREQGWTDHNG